MTDPTKDELLDLIDDVADALASDDVDAARELLGLDDDDLDDADPDDDANPDDDADPDADGDE